MSSESLEQEMKQVLQRAGIRYRDNTSSFHELDFALMIKPDAVLYLDVKEKRQRYNLVNWSQNFAPEEQLFILDDLTVRKCIGYAPRSGILVRDNLFSQYHFFSVFDLALMPRQRVNRAINRNTPEMKGKWLINLQNGATCSTIQAALTSIEEYVESLPLILDQQHSCFGRYIGETIGSGGIERNPGHWEEDIQATR